MLHYCCLGERDSLGPFNACGFNASSNSGLCNSWSYGGDIDGSQRRGGELTELVPVERVMTISGYKADAQSV